MNHFRRKLFPAIGLATLFALILASCGESRQPFVGTYKSDEIVAGKGHIQLTLKDTGEAEWSWVEEGRTAKFKWRVQDGRIWLYTKEGAIVIVTPSQDGQHLSADMTGDWQEGCPTDKCISFTRHK